MRVSRRMRCCPSDYASVAAAANCVRCIVDPSTIFRQDIHYIGTSYPVTIPGERILARADDSIIHNSCFPQRLPPVLGPLVVTTEGFRGPTSLSRTRH